MSGHEGYGSGHSQSLSVRKWKQLDMKFKEVETTGTEVLGSGNGWWTQLELKCWEVDTAGANVQGSGHTWN